MRLSVYLVVLGCTIVALGACAAARADPGESEPLEPAVAQEHVAEMRADTQDAIEDLVRIQTLTPRVDAIMDAINDMWSRFAKLHRSVAKGEELLETAETLSQLYDAVESPLERFKEGTPALYTAEHTDDEIRAGVDQVLVEAVKEVMPMSADLEKRSVRLSGSMGSIHNLGLELEGIRRRASELGPLAFNCEAGTAPYNGDGACAGCDLGHFAPANSGSCSPCPRGTYADATHSATCTECAPGKVAHDPGTVLCEDCPAGRVSAGAGASLCVACPQYSLPSHDRTTCETCPPGTEYHTSGCVACPAGTFRAADSMPVCHGCPPNTYSSAVRATECQPCGENEFTFDALGNTDVSECRSCAESWHAFDRGEGPAIPIHALPVCATALCTLRAGAVGRQMCRMYGNATELEELEAARARGALATASWATVFIVPLLVSCLFVVVLWMRNLPRIKSVTHDVIESFAAVFALAEARWSALRASTESLARSRDSMQAEPEATGAAEAGSDAIALDTLARDSASTDAGPLGEHDAPSPVPQMSDGGNDASASSALDERE